MSFSAEIPAKCILAGEHTILQRGHAIVVPFNKYQLSLTYTADNNIKTLHTISGDGINSMQIILWPVIRRAFELLDKDIFNLTGFFDIKSTIPPCGGLGFSAALCVAVAKWAVHYGILPASQLFDFAVTLEDGFHGKSSGLDIAGVMSENIIQYFSNREIAPLAMNWKPNLYISSSGESSFSESCIKKVNRLREKDKVKAEAIDDKMSYSAILVKQALEQESKKGLPLLSAALNLGNECFYEWDLVSPKLNDHLIELKKAALSCKIVGAGFGGHVISLWEDIPPKDLSFKLIPVF
ncbi:MAG: mevalonate kinase [Proteobacteria bacterium]|nr:mevalonate kinase [Pseudomonadota bacterium]